MAKRTTLKEAIAEFVRDGDSIALEGFSHLVPFAAGHEIIRQQKRNLTLIRMSADLIFDQMIGMGCARKLVFSWAGNPGLGLLHRFRDAVEKSWPQPLELEEYTHAALAAAFAAGAARLPFGVIRDGSPNDLQKHTTTIASMECPFTRENVTAVRAMNPDVTIIHAQRADEEGNVQLWGITGIQKEAVLAAKKAVVTVEEICERLEPVPNGIVIPSWVIASVVHAPGGARPSYAHGYYSRDDAFYREWDVVARDRDRFMEWMDRNVLGVRPRMNYTSEEMMTIAAARKFRDRSVCFVGVGLPSVAACVARELHAPNMTLVYESGAIGAKPTKAPLSIADLELAETADFIVSVPEIFGYWLQGGRIDAGFLGAAQIDRFGNLNSTVIGNYNSPKVRLPGAGGAPHIAANVRETIVIVRQTPKAFVPRLDFLTTPQSRRPTIVVTDLGILETHPTTRELVLTARHEGVSVEQVRQATGWPLVVSDDLRETAAPTERELSVLRELG